MSPVVNGLQYLGAGTVSRVRSLGHLVIFTVTAMLLAFTLPLKLRRVVEQVYEIGVVSVLVVTFTALFTGMVLGLQGYHTLRTFGSEGMLGGAVALSLIRELGPVLAALMVTGRAGSSIAAKLGAMRISEQIDALDTMDINPIKFLVSPRLIAAIIAMPILTAFFDVVGIFGGYLTGVIMLGVSPGSFFASLESATSMDDLISGLIKPFFFGFVIAAVSCYRGYHCEQLRVNVRGTEGVSLATTSSVVIASVSILVLDYVLTAFTM